MTRNKSTSKKNPSTSRNGHEEEIKKLRAEMQTLQNKATTPENSLENSLENKVKYPESGLKVSKKPIDVLSKEFDKL